jgi:hypothetical protein
MALACSGAAVATGAGYAEPQRGRFEMGKIKAHLTAVRGCLKNDQAAILASIRLAMDR